MSAENPDSKVAAIQFTVVFANAGNLLPGVQSIIDAEQKLISRELDQNRIMSPTLNQQNPLYAPETGETFQLRTYWIPAEKTHFFVSDNVYAKTEERMIKKIGGKKYPADRAS